MKTVSFLKGERMNANNKIADIIEESLEYIYCHNCKHKDTDDETCDYCNRKSMGWEISHDEAMKIANKICDTVGVFE